MPLKTGYTEFKDKIKARLKPSRFIHSVGVAETAFSIAKKFGLDEEKALICGIYHDAFRYSATFSSIPFILSKGIVLSADELENEGFLHGPLAAASFDDDAGEAVPRDMKDAVRHHTLGSKEMGRLGAAVFVSDWAEPGRTETTEEERRAILSLSSLEEMTLGVIDAEIERYGEASLKAPTKALKAFLEGGGAL